MATDASTLHHAPAARVRFSFMASDGPLGTWDLQQLQRGYQVYKEVCSACHSLKYVAMRDLAQLGYTEAEINAFLKPYHSDICTLRRELIVNKLMVRSAGKYKVVGWNQ